MDYQQQFNVFYRSLKDRPQDLDKCLDFLYDLIRVRGEKAPPLVEIITIIRYEKPKLYENVKNTLRNHPTMKLLFEMNGNYEEAKKTMEVHEDDL